MGMSTLLLSTQECWKACWVSHQSAEALSPLFWRNDIAKELQHAQHPVRWVLIAW